MLFWKDKWCGPTPLCVEYPNLFAIATSKDALVSDVWSMGENGGCRNPLFSRSLYDWELEEVDSFVFGLSRNQVREGLEVKMSWLKEKKWTVLSEVSL